jgi:hypothetical protein
MYQIFVFSEGPPADWALAALLLDAVGVLLLLGIKEHRTCNLSNSAAATTGQIENAAPWGLLQDKCQTRK